MPNKASDIATYKFEQSEDCILDANVWLFLYGPSDPTDPRIAIYSSALRRMIEAKCKIHLDVTLLSEYINRHARIEFDMLREYTNLAATNFKQFRESPDFVPIARTIAVVAKKIVAMSERIELNFAACPIPELLEEFAKGGTDFNDQLIGHTCRNRKLTLITDDGDFRTEGIKVLTANRKLIHA